MRMSKIETFNSMNNSEHLRKKVGMTVDVDQIVIMDDVTYMLNKESGVFSESTSGRKEMAKIEKLFSDDLQNKTLKITIDFKQTSKGNDVYSFTIVE